MGSSSTLDPAFGPSAGSREGLDGGCPLGHPPGLWSLGPTVPSAHSWGRRAGSRQALGLGAPLPARRRRNHKPDITALEASANLVLGCPGGTCWGSRTHPRPGPTAPVARPGRERGPLGLPVVRPPWCSRSAEHPPRRKSSLRASSASSRSPPADSRPEPSSPRASMGPAAATLRPQTFPGLSEATASVAPGRRPSDSGRCWALRPRAALGPGASDRAEGGAAGGRGRGAGRGPGGAETFQGRPPALRALAGTGRGGAGPGLPAGAGQGPAAPCLRVRSAG